MQGDAQWTGELALAVIRGSGHGTAGTGGECRGEGIEPGAMEWQAAAMADIGECATITITTRNRKVHGLQSEPARYPIFPWHVETFHGREQGSEPPDAAPRSSVPMWQSVFEVMDFWLAI